MGKREDSTSVCDNESVYECASEVEKLAAQMGGRDKYYHSILMGKAGRSSSSEGGWLGISPGGTACACTLFNGPLHTTKLDSLRFSPSLFLQTLPAHLSVCIRSLASA